jgi:hypothetical protein
MSGVFIYEFLSTPVMSFRVPARECKQSRCCNIFASMNTNSMFRTLIPIVLIFIAVSVICLVVPGPLSNLSIDPNVLLVGNIILFVATLVSFMFYRRSLTNNHAPFFMRMIYSAMFAKMMICMLSAFIYIVTYKKEVSKGGIFACMFLYFLYTFVELFLVLKLSKEKKNA